ncbi:hypothetical protein V6N13_016708 [Hibiscus sabdariffa]
MFGSFGETMILVFVSPKQWENRVDFWWFGITKVCSECRKLIKGCTDQRINSKAFSWKIYKLKGVLKKWNSEQCCNFDAKVKILEGKLNALEENGNVLLTYVEQEEIRKVRAALWDMYHLQESLGRQKPRLNWLSLGDSNTMFFLKAVKIRSIKEGMDKIKIGKRWIVSQVLKFNSLSDKEAQMLEVQFSLEEIKAAVWSCKSTYS